MELRFTNETMGRGNTTKHMNMTDSGAHLYREPGQFESGIATPRLLLARRLFKSFFGTLDRKTLWEVGRKLILLSLDIT